MSEAKFIYWSDLHAETRDWPPVTPRPDDPGAPGDADGILIAGDLAPAGRIADLCGLVWADWRVPVICVEGNHDLYGSRKRAVHKIRAANDDSFARWRAAGAEISLLRRGGSVVVAGTRIVGATLWTDLRLNPAVPPAAAAAHAERVMNDHKHIHMRIGGVTRKARASDLVAEHRADVAGVRAACAEPFGGPTIVMTHHLPLAACLDRRYATPADMADNASYASDLTGLVREIRADAWVFGHSHSGQDLDLRIGDDAFTAFRTNPLGYPHEETAFDPWKTISVPVPGPAAEPDPGGREDDGPAP